MSSKGITNRLPGRETGWAPLIRACDRDLTEPAAVEGEVRASLLRDWRLLAGAELSAKILGAWPAAIDPGELDRPAEAWIPAAAWLALHRLLILHGWRGDAQAFAEDWHRLVLGRLGRPARWALRAYGLPRAVQHLPQLWAHAYRAPQPQVQLDDRTLTLAFASHPLLDAPLARLLLACQARLACEVLTGRIYSMEYKLLSEGWGLELPNVS